MRWTATSSRADAVLPWQQGAAPGASGLTDWLGAAGTAGGALVVCLLWITRYLVPRLQDELKESREAFAKILQAQWEEFGGQLEAEREHRNEATKTLQTLSMEIRVVADRIQRGNATISGRHQPPAE